MPLAIHHLDSLDTFPEKASNENNGVLIETNIHTDFHHRYGFGKNTKEQFEEYMVKQYNRKISFGATH